MVASFAAMDHLVAEAVEHYHLERPHQAKNNDALIRPPSDLSKSDDEQEGQVQVECRERLGGVLEHYYYARAA